MGGECRHRPREDAAAEAKIRISDALASYGLESIPCLRVVFVLPQLFISAIGEHSTTEFVIDLMFVATHQPWLIGAQRQRRKAKEHRRAARQTRCTVRRGCIESQVCLA